MHCARRQAFCFQVIAPWRARIKTHTATGKREILDEAGVEKKFGVRPERIIDYLKTVPMDGLTEADKNLYRLAATWMEMSHPVDLRWNDTDERDVFPFERVHLVEPSPSD